MPDSLDFLAPGAAGTTALLAARIGGVLLIAPVFSGRPVPHMLRAALLVLLTALLLPAVLAGSGSPAAGGVAPIVTPAALAVETVVGFAIGLGAAVVVGAAEVAGDLLAIHMGLSGATMLDPMTSQSAPMLGQFTRWFAVALLLALNGHLLMIEALAATLEVIPVGGDAAVAQGAWAMAQLGGSLFELGLRMAAPVTAAVLIANVALGILARTVPQMNVLMVAFPVQIGIGLFTLGVALPLIGTLMLAWPANYDSLLTQLIGTLAGNR
jgi:flagellar biosynthetic protein FliR